MTMAEGGGEWTKIQATVDSGSAEHALPSKAYKGIEAKRGERFGKKYVAANGGTIKNEGEKILPCVTDVGLPINIKFQMAAVVKPLISAKKLAQQGHVVILEEAMPRIISPEGFCTPIKVQGGVYVIDLWVRRCHGSLSDGDTGFKGQ